MPSPGTIVVLDGPAGAGKSTVARHVAAALGLPMLDTGAIYRALALWASRRQVPWDDEQALARLAEHLPLRFEAPPEAGAPGRVWLGEEDVTRAIRTPEISDGASRVSALPAVRAALLGLQRRLARGGCVAEGRDMGTVVFPGAPFKFFVTADLDTRARRREADLRARGQAPPPLDELREQIRARDERDASRAVAPLRPAEDARLLDTSHMTVDEVVATVLDRVRAGA